MYFWDISPWFIVILKSKLPAVFPQVEHGMCVLARNVMHQYIFLILWWALAAMIIVNVLNVIAGLINVFFRQVTSSTV